MGWVEGTNTVNVDVTAIDSTASYPLDIAVHIAMLETYIDW